MRDLTTGMAERLGAVSPTYRSWIRADELREIAEIVARPEGGGAGDVDLARLEETARALADVEETGGREPELQSLRRVLADHQRDLALLGLSDRQLADGDRPGHRRLVLAWSAVRVLAAWPAAVAGTVGLAFPPTGS